MKLTSKMLRAERYLDSVVYYFNILADDVAIKDGDQDKEFAIQVQDGCDATDALVRYLQGKKQELESVESPSLLPDIEV